MREKNIISHGGHLEIQDGRLLDAIFYIRNRILTPENMVLDTETVFLLLFKAEIWREREFNGGHFENQDGCWLPWQPGGYLA